MKTSLPLDSQERKDTPVNGGCLMYFPAALAGVARHSKRGNDKHNPGQTLHHARGKSMDHSECIVRHGMDINDFLAHIYRSRDPRNGDAPTDAEVQALLAEADALCWRSLAWSQELYERFGGAPLAPAAKVAEERCYEVCLANPAFPAPHLGCECLRCDGARARAFTSI